MVKIYYSIAILHEDKYLLNQQAIYTLYCSFMLPYRTYCLEVWDTKQRLTPTGRIRFITNSTHRRTKLFVKLKSFKFKDVDDLKAVQFMYKFKKGVTNIPNNSKFVKMVAI